MNKRARTKIVYYFILVAIFLCIVLVLPSGASNPGGETPIGYEFLDDGKVVHIWNTQDDYYFDKSSGMQFSNHFQEYWSKNIFCIGYYSGGNWNKIKCADELGEFNRDIQTDNKTYVNATLWKDFAYSGYDMRLGVRYHLKTDDESLSVIIYGKNIGVDIPYDLGFAWIVTDWEIPDRNTVGGDSIRINNSDYELNRTYNLLFKNMTKTYVDYIINETTGEIIGNETIVEPIPFLRGYDYGSYLTINWNENLNYAVKMYGNGNQEDFYVALLINAGHFNPQQEKSTIIYWIDAAWDVSTAVYLQEFSVAAKETHPDEVFFKPDGTKMYTMGSTGDTVDEYDLSTAWDVSTAVYLQEFSVAAKEAYPTGVFFKPDGTKMYTIGRDGDTVDEYDLSTAWDISTAVYLQEFSVAAKEEYPQGVFFKPDGTKMYTIGYAGSTVDEYDLSTAWNVSTAVFLQQFGVGVKEIYPLGVFFKSDGTKMYTIGRDGDTVDEYDLSTAWDVSTAVYLQEFSVAAKEASPSGVFFKPDGTKMYTIGYSGDTVDEYDLLVPNTPPNVSTPIIIPSPAYAGDTLNCSVKADDNETTSLNVSFKWYKNNAHQTAYDNTTECTNATICYTKSNVTETLKKDDVWICEAWAGDGTHNGTKRNSSSVTIGPYEITGCTALDEAGATYLLKANISNSTTSKCINITANNITLDCRNNIIDGDDEADYGIYVYRDSAETTNVTIRNCKVIDWDAANIYLRRADSNTLINITSTSSPSSDEGIWLNDADSNTLTNITANDNGGSGIYLGTDSDFNTLTNITANSNDYGIYFYFADSNTLTNITANSNSLYGIWIYGADSNTFTNTSANSNTQYGIYLLGSTSNTFNNVTADNNSYSGIYFSSGSGSNILTNVTANDNEQNGIYISGSGSNTFKNVTANSNNWHGIRVGTYSDSNNFINITANSNSEYGIFLYYSDSNTIKESEFWNNTQAGVYSYGDSNSNVIYNNLFNNTLNFGYLGIGNNSWNTTQTTGTNIVGQGWIGGNYWANPTGNGYSDTCWDRTGDYICENSYTLAADNTDYLPLTSNSDTDAPTIPNVSISPNTDDDLDPDVQINVTANITDATTGVDTTILQYKFHSAPTFINVTMRYNSTTKLYNASFTPDAEGEWTYRVWANDTANNIYNTTATNASVYKDYTWVRSPADAGTILGILTTTKEILNLTINNTGEYSLSFDISDTAPYGSSYNQTIPFTIAAGESKTIAFDATFGSTTREDAVVITIDSTTPNADPSETTTNFTLASYAGGPFFDVIIDPDTPDSINQSRTAIIRAYVKNIGNETSIQTWLNWTLPSGVTNTTGNITQNVSSNETSNLTAGSTLYNTLNITVNETTVEIGSITIYAKATGLNSTNGKISKEANKSITITCYSGDGVCGKGCNYHTDTDCEVPQNVTTTTTTPGGGGGVPSVFKAEATYELVRGRDQIFILPLKNPYSSKTLTNIRVRASGYLAQYIKIEPPENVSANETGEIKVKILAPSYFTVGMHNLTFTIQLIAVEKGTADISRIEKRYVHLAIHELGKEDSEKLINEIENYINSLKKLNLETEGIEELYDKSLDAINKSDYESVNEIYEESKELAEAAFNSYSIVKGLEEKLNETSKYGIETPKTGRLVNLAKSALERGDYLLALERVKDAQLTYIIETKGKFGLIYYIRKNTFEFFLYTIATLIILTILYFRTKILVINYNLKGLQQEEDTLLGLMRVVQKECFEERKMSMSEYNDAMLQYEDKLSKAVQKTIELEAVKANLLKFKHRKLELERERLLDLMKATQEKYLREGAIETQVYNNKMHSFVSRLSELEENLALQEAKQTLRKRKLFWRIFYSVFQPKPKDKKD